MTIGTNLITQERQRQIHHKGFTLEHDEEHLPGDLTDAAICYALYAWWQIFRDSDGNPTGWTREMVENMILDSDTSGGVVGWPWDESGWKPDEDPVVNLKKAGAMIAAEIDRHCSQKQNGLQGEDDGVDHAL